MYCNTLVRIAGWEELYCNTNRLYCGWEGCRRKTVSQYKIVLRQKGKAAKQRAGRARGAYVGAQVGAGLGC